MSEANRLPFCITLAVWRRAASEAMWLLAGCVLVMFAFHWLYVYLTSLVSSSSFAGLFAELPDSMGGMLGISIAEAATPRGRIALGYVDPTVVVIVVVWALTRGSDAVSGPLDRGTLELTLAQPVSRLTVLSANMGVTLIGAALIASAAWLGTCAGVATVSVEQDNVMSKVILGNFSLPFAENNALSRLLFAKPQVPLWKLVAYQDFIPSAVNLFSLTMLMAGYTTLVSACDRFRWRTLGIAGSFTLIQVVMKMTGLASVKLKWLFNFTILGAYWPQVLALSGDRVWELSWRYNGILLCGAILCYVAAAAVFTRRDLPAPL